MNVLNLIDSRVKIVFYLALIAFSTLGCKTAIRMTFLYKPHINDHRRFTKKEIPASVNPVNPFSKGPQAMPDLACWAKPELLEKLKANNLEEFLEKTNTTKFIVVRNDTVLYENYANGSSASKQDVIFSITKVFVTSLVGIALEEGKIKSIHQPVCDFIPAFCLDERKAITINHLLQMTSGLNYGDYKNVITAGFTYYSPNLAKFVAQAKLAYPPGTHFAYKSIDTQVLGLCLEQAVGMSIADYLHQKIWEPLGMERPAYFTLDSKQHGNERMYGGMTAAPHDLLKMGKLILDGGQWDGQQVLPKEWVASLHKRTIKDDKWWGYSKGWWLDVGLSENLLESSHLQAAGFNGQLLFLFPTSNTIILRQGYNKGGVEWGLSLSKLNKTLEYTSLNCDNNTPIDKKKFSGLFLDSKGCKNKHIKVGIVNNRFSIELSDKRQNIEAKLVGDRLLVADNGQLQLIFEKQQGQIIGCYLDHYGCELPFYEKVD